MKMIGESRRAFLSSFAYLYLSRDFVKTCGNINNGFDSFGLSGCKLTDDKVKKAIESLKGK